MNDSPGGKRAAMEVDCCSFVFMALLPLCAVWYLQVATVTRLASSHADRLALYLAPPVCLAVLAVCMLWADWVGGGLNGARLVLLFAGAGGACLFVATFAFPWLGLSPRDDVVERRNRPAGWTVAGALLGLALAFGLAAGGAAPKAFRGPVPSGVAAMLALLAVWGALELVAGLSEAITVERDRGCAIRLALFLPVAGLLIGLAAVWL